MTEVKTDLFHDLLSLFPPFSLHPSELDSRARSGREKPENGRDKYTDIQTKIVS